MLTVKALCLINRADVVVYDRLVSEEVMGLVPAGVSRIFVGKEDGNHSVAQEDINQILVRLARSGRKVVRLKGGDPFVFGRGGEEAEHLAKHGIDYEIVPGVTAATACTAYAGIPLTHRDLSHGVTFVTGHGNNGRSLEEEIAERYAVDRGATLVIFMGLGRLAQILDALKDRGMSGNMPMALIEKGTTRDQRCVLTTVDSACRDATIAGLAPPTLIVVGEVVRLADTLSWFVPKADGRDAKTVGG